MPLIYLDNCALQRPLDDRTQFRVRVEAEAITTVLQAIEAGEVELATSAALRAESSRARHRNRRDFAERVLALASRDAPAAATMRTRIQTYQDAGLRPFDALHLASAVTMSADYFCTADDHLLRRAREVNTETTRVVTPLELAQELNL